MSDFRGKFLWYELLTTDPGAARAYYTEVIGWSTDLWEGGEQPYTMFKAPRGAFAGLMELPEEAKQGGAPPHWLAYVGTPDIDATLAKIPKLGGKAVTPVIDIPEVGRVAVVSDPQGAHLAVYTPAGDPPGFEGPPEMGEISWHELATTDIDAAWSFYEALFGWKKTETMDMGEAGVYQMFGRGEQTLGGIFVKPPEMPAPPHWLLYARVPDVNKTVEAVKARGGQVLNGPMEVPGGDLVAQCMDPQGAAFAIHSSAAA